MNEQIIAHVESHATFKSRPDARHNLGSANLWNNEENAMQWRFSVRYCIMVASTFWRLSEIKTYCKGDW